MKKTVMLIVTMSMLFFLIASGCVDEDETIESGLLESEPEDMNNTYEYLLEKSEKQNQEELSMQCCNWDWKWFTTKAIDYSTAPSGYTYAVCTVYIQNNARQSVSTNPGYWNLVIDGVTYNHDVMTFSSVIDYNNVDVGYGGEFETQFVFLIRDDKTRGSIYYSGYDMPCMNMIKHYKTADELETEEELKGQAFYDALLADIKSNGYNVTSIETRETTKKGVTTRSLIFDVDNTDEVINIFEIGLIAYDATTDRPDYYVIRVDSDPDKEYLTTKNDVKVFKRKYTDYEEYIFVTIPDGRTVSLKKLPSKIK